MTRIRRHPGPVHHAQPTPTHTVGQSVPLASLAVELGVSVEDMLRLNPRLADLDRVPAGSQVVLPDGKAETPAPTPVPAPTEATLERPPVDAATQAGARQRAVNDPTATTLRHQLDSAVPVVKEPG